VARATLRRSAGNDGALADQWKEQTQPNRNDPIGHHIRNGYVASARPKDTLVDDSRNRSYGRGIDCKAHGASDRITCPNIAKPRHTLAQVSDHAHVAIVSLGDLSVNNVPVLFDPYADRMFLHPVIAVVILVICAMTLVGSRKYALIAAMLTLNFITPAQRVFILNMNLPAMRIFIFAAVVRIFIRNTHCRLRILNLDKVVVFYGIASVVSYTLQSPSLGSLNNAFGTFLDSVGAYFVVRVLITDLSDLYTLVRVLTVIGIAMLILFVIEYRTGVNVLGRFGGVPLTPDIREGRARIQGPYPHPILAGAYWAAVIPLFLGFRIGTNGRDLQMYVAVGVSLALVALTASSTPIASAAFGIGASLFFSLRHRLTDAKLILIFMLVAISLWMRHPIWFLLARVDLVGGSTGYYRFLLVDSFIRHWSDWFAIGLRDTASWSQGLGMNFVGLRDLANQFVYEGTRGGIVTLLLFLAGAVVALSYVGRLVREAADLDDARRFWHVGVSVFVHLANFVAVSYFGQVKFAWWMTLAICGSLHQSHMFAGERVIAETASISGSAVRTT